MRDRKDNDVVVDDEEEEERRNSITQVVHTECKVTAPQTSLSVATASFQ